MKISCGFSKLCLAVVAVSVATSVFGASWFANGPKRRVDTLIITGNYKSSRLMAELIQNESYQPYLLVPAAESGDTKITWIPAKGPAREILPQNVNRFVRQLNPSRIVVVGDSRYVPTEYVQLLDGEIPFMRVQGNDWNRIADELTFMLNLSNLSDNYRKLRADLLSAARVRPVWEVPAGSEQLPAAAEEAPEKTAELEEIEMVELPAAE